MSVSRENQVALAREIKSLIDSNKENAAVLAHAYELAKVALGILENEEDSINIGFELQEYAYEHLEIAEGKTETPVWISHNDAAIRKVIESI